MGKARGDVVGNKMKNVRCKRCLDNLWNVHVCVLVCSHACVMYDCDVGIYASRSSVKSSWKSCHMYPHCISASRRTDFLRGVLTRHFLPH